jgi:prepilin-type N-terminal cleavage/methylation domain-containing protein
MKRCNRGFSVLELLTVLAIIALLAGIAIPLYQNHIEKAKSAEIILKYDALRSGLQADLSNGVVSSCEDIVSKNAGANLGEDYARLSLGFQAINGVGLNGYRPVLLVCASDAVQGSLAVRVAKAAYDEFKLTNRIDAGELITESMVSFAVPLTLDETAVCRVPSGGALTPCGTPVAVPTVPAQLTTTVSPPAQQPVAVPVPLSVAAPALLAPMSESVATDFSQPRLDPNQHNGQWMMVNPGVWGWKTDNPDGNVEYGRGSAYGDTSGGNIGVIELEGQAGTPSNLYRDIATQVGAQYKFSFDLSGRTGVSSDSAAVEVVWEGKVIATLRPAENTFGFVSHAYDLVATQAGSRIELRAVTRDGTGPVVDNLFMKFTGVVR